MSQVLSSVVAGTAKKPIQRFLRLVLNHSNLWLFQRARHSRGNFQSTQTQLISHQSSHRQESSPPEALPRWTVTMGKNIAKI